MSVINVFITLNHIIRCQLGCSVDAVRGLRAVVRGGAGEWYLSIWYEHRTTSRMCAYVWLCLALFGYVWLGLALLGYVWLRLAICCVCGYVWLCLDRRQWHADLANRLETNGAPFPVRCYPQVCQVCQVWRDISFPEAAMAWHT